MNLTKADAALLGRRRAQPVKGPDELLAVFVAGRLVNPLNGSHGHWSKHARWARQWRERTTMVLHEWYMANAVELGRGRNRDLYYPFPSDTPKRITFAALVPSRFDDDNLAACCKPLRDALKDARVIVDDRPSARHVFAYEQRAARKADTVYGVTIRVRPLELSTEETL